MEVLHSNKVQFLLSYSHSVELLSLLPLKSQTVLEVRRHISGKANGRGFAKEVLLNNLDIFGTANGN
jgi:hypothetical protein